MRHILVVLGMVWSVVSVTGQITTDTIGGEVSFKTSQNIYVRFASTQRISIGDTLYMSEAGQIVPVMVVKSSSSTSCVGTPLTSVSPEVGTKIIARVKARKEIIAPKEDIAQQIPPEIKAPQEIPEEEPEHAREEPQKQPRKTESLKGRISAASYINFSDHPENDKQRMRYTLNLTADRLGNSNLSAETYLSFRHTLNEWQEVKDNFKKAFKVYSLAFKYDLNESTHVWFGRKINFNISNIGAIDGLQIEKNWNTARVGVFAGSRPDHTDYWFNFDLLQFGAYVGHTVEGKNGTIQNTLAIAEQRNHNMTDRRFAYFQHLNSMIKRINIFTSFEFNLYKFEDDRPQSTLDISSVYFSIRYKVSDKLSVFGSYDARKNIIYYETYKNFIDQLLEEETRQGYRLSFNYRPLKKVTIGSSAGYRFQKDNPGPSKNLNSYITYSRIPGIGVSATASVVMIQSAYLDGLIYGIRASRDILKGKLHGEVEYRQVEYRYKNVEFPLEQSIVGANLSWRFSKRMSFSVNYEGEIRNKKISNRIYTHVTQRF